MCVTMFKRYYSSNKDFLVHTKDKMLGYPYIKRAGD
nr:MAG TPA: hypothetical protein [Caudoviricetes sp.]